MIRSRRPREPQEERTELPEWAAHLLEALGIDAVVKFVLLCHFRDHAGRRFERPQLPVWCPERDRAVRGFLESLAERGVLSRYAGRREVSYWFSPDETNRGLLDRFFAYAHDGWGRAQVVRWIVRRDRTGGSGTRRTDPF
jgi:hypothetical protein